MTFQERAERLKNHPDTVTVEICGEARPWFLGKVTYDLARAKGIEFGDVLASFEGMDEGAGVDKLGGMMGAFGRLLYFGMLPFEEHLDESDVTDLLSFGDMPRLLPQLMDKLGAAAEEEGGKVRAAAARGAQGAADRRRRP